MDKKYKQIVALRGDVKKGKGPTLAHPYPINLGDDDDRYFKDRQRSHGMTRAAIGVSMNDWHGRFEPYDAPLPQQARPKAGEIWETNDGRKITIREQVPN